MAAYSTMSDQDLKDIVTKAESEIQTKSAQRGAIVKEIRALNADRDRAAQELSVRKLRAAHPGLKIETA